MTNRDDLVALLRGRDPEIERLRVEVERLQAIFRTQDNPDWADLHLHRADDGTITAVPMRRAVEEDEPVMVEVFTGVLHQNGDRLWVDATKEPA